MGTEPDLPLQAEVDSRRLADNVTCLSSFSPHMLALVISSFPAVKHPSPIQGTTLERPCNEGQVLCEQLFF